MTALAGGRWINRRTALAAGGAACLLGCQRTGSSDRGLAWTGGFVGEAVAAGHRWRDRQEPGSAPVGVPPRRCDVLIVGAGVAGLSAARALRQAGVDDIVLLELHEQAGGNSRAHQVNGQWCPMGAHYLPVPESSNHELMRWLHEIGLARQVLGRTVFDERHLCHSPQERVWHDGQWHEGLLPPLTPGSPGYVQAQRLSQAIAGVGREARFSMPSTDLPWGAMHQQLDRQTFAQWLDEAGISDGLLRWYLDYCCLDDYGAPASVVSAWAGIHYFASRHGFQGSDEQGESPRDAVFTWPEGNQWLARRLAEPVCDRLQTGWLASHVVEYRDHVSVVAQAIRAARTPGQNDADPAARGAGPGAAAEDGEGEWREWRARQVILAVPLAWADRLLASRHAALARVARQLQASPWLVANLRLKTSLIERPGMPPAWDNVVAGRSALGYVDSHHQTLGRVDAAPLLTAYHALPLDRRAQLLNQPWSAWSAWVVDELAVVHADLPDKVLQVDITRHGHAMAVPRPGLRGHPDLAALRARPLSARVHLAHADLAGYSVFEEAFALGLASGRRAAQALGAREPRSS